MELFFKFIAAWVAIAMIIPFYRTLVGPTVFDRLVGTGAVATKTVVFILLVGFIFDRFDMFVDISIAYAILNFIGTLVIAQYFSKENNKENLG